MLLFVQGVAETNSLQVYQILLFAKYLRTRGVKCPYTHKILLVVLKHGHWFYIGLHPNSSFATLDSIGEKIR